MDVMIDGSTLVLSGQIDVRCSSRLRDLVYETLMQEHLEVVLDVRGVEAVDITTLRMLAVASRNAAREGRGLSLRSPSVAVRRMMAMSHLKRFLTVQDLPSVMASA